MASARGEHTPSPAISADEAASLWTLLTNAPPTTPRERLLVGMAAAIQERGLAASTVADVVRHARASRRTFYEHFRDRDDCYLALYEVSMDRLVWLFENSLTPGDDWFAEIAGASEVYLTGLTAVPALARAGIAEMTSLGPRALEVRHAGLQRLADVLIALHEEARQRHADIPSREISPEQGLALMAGLHELVLVRVQEDRIEDVVTELAPVSARMTYLLGVVSPD